MKKAGARPYLILVAITIVSTVVLVNLDAISYDDYLALLAFAVVLIVTGLTEVRFYELRNKLENIENKVDELKQRPRGRPSSEVTTEEDGQAPASHSRSQLKFKVDDRLPNHILPLLDGSEMVT